MCSGSNTNPLYPPLVTPVYRNPSVPSCGHKGTSTRVCPGMLPGHACPSSHPCTLRQARTHRQTFVSALPSAPMPCAPGQAGPLTGDGQRLLHLYRGDSSQLSTLHNIPYQKGRCTEEIQRPHSISPAPVQTSGLLVHPCLSFRCRVSVHEGLPDSSLAGGSEYWSLVLTPQVLF